ncbi:N-acetylmuramic acid 6-phosphate etherase [Phyllobacterium sp. 0TCS1.6C]|uniref:N-acetylmuramic acid 6-phosphate etherase n=1 Tax=unclassified Phyllobacterium TaxID=2638441 RepID=UPI0022641B12|nr:MULTISPECIES: N-acetylmuramic acid 6-phosphate etherase [unclassified Phyllobacterium]MCX8279646.1 N-acetylmuramic acid 6-phosphate etherase [Phyllobacterium sp. 0TCS1.6C]MCX8292163.1 N-acetylmuramic acid 6-phosphate etherase [Phyllobacterium sp. 0TCS1.6A]
MALTRTEQRNDKAVGLDEKSPAEVLGLLLDAQIAAAEAVRPALPSIARAAQLAARTLADGGRLVYAAAGSSGLMALADALEIPGTYGIAADRIVLLLAGGLASLERLAGGYEDDVEQASRDIAGANIGPKDCLIAISASGTTPYALGAMGQARQRGARIIGIANNSNVPLLDAADVAIVLETPAEIVAGSTRMGAGTAQKLALNLMSTLMAVELGHVHDGYMVNLIADNIKLRDRAARIVAAISGCDLDAARRHLDSSGGSVKAAVLLAAGAENGNAALGILESNQQRLRPALSELKGSMALVNGTAEGATGD